MRGAENETAGDTFSGAGRADVKFTKEYHPKPTRRPGFTATTEYASSWPPAIAGGFACFGGVDASVYHAARLETGSFRTQIEPEPHGGRTVKRNVTSRKKVRFMTPVPLLWMDAFEGMLPDKNESRVSDICRGRARGDFSGRTGERSPGGDGGGGYSSLPCRCFSASSIAAFTAGSVSFVRW